MVEIENKFVDIGFILEEEMAHVKFSKINKLQAKGCSKNEKEENNIFKDIFKYNFDEAHIDYKENTSMVYAQQYEVGEKKVIYDSLLCFEYDNIIDLG